MRRFLIFLSFGVLAMAQNRPQQNQQNNAAANGPVHVLPIRGDMYMIAGRG